MAEPPVFDWEDSGFTEGFFVLLLWEFSRQSLQNWLYYVVANKADNISELTRLSGILRGQESFAQAISFGINTRRWHGGRVPMAVNTILLGKSLVTLSRLEKANHDCAGLAAYPTWLVAREMQPVEDQKEAGPVDNNAPDTGDEKITTLEKVASLDGDDKSRSATISTSIGEK